MASQTDAAPGKPPPYIPWKSFIGYLDALKKTTVPHTLDNTARPQTMAGGLWNQLVSALQFLGLVKANKEAEDSLSKLVKSHGTPEWKVAVKDFLLPPYKRIIGDLPIESATTGQLEKRFHENGRVDGQLLEKSIRFYLHALKDGGVKYSSYLGMRRDKGQSRKASANKRKKAKDGAPIENGQDPKKMQRQEQPDEMPPSGLIEQRLYFKGKPAGCIRVPENLSVEDCVVIELQLAVLKAYASQGAAEGTD